MCTRFHRAGLTCGWAGVLIWRAGLFLALGALCAVSPLRVRAASPVVAGTLREVQQIRTLNPEEAALSHPVLVRGVVTFVDRVVGELFVQDETGGVCVQATAIPPSLVAGDRVEVRGVSGPGDYAPVVAQAELRGLGKDSLPEPGRYSLHHLRTGREDSQWIEVAGIVRSFRIEAGRPVLTLAVEGERMKVHLPVGVELPVGERLVDAAVRVRGTCATLFNERRQLLGIKLLTPDYAQVLVDQPAAASVGDLPLKPIGTMLQFNPGRVPGHRVRVQGVVTLRRSDNLLYVRDETDSLLVNTLEAADVRPGDVVEVVGFPEYNPFTPELKDAVYRKVGQGHEPEAVDATAREARAGLFDGELIRMRGLLLDHAVIRNDKALVVEADGSIFYVRIESAKADERISSLRKGSRLELRGVCAVQIDDTAKQAIGFRLLLRSPADIRVLEEPSWWTPERIQQLLGTIAALAILGMVWVISLHERVRKQARIIQERLERETALEQQYRDLFENANDVIYTLDLQGRFTSLNKAAETVMGVPRADAVRRDLGSLVAPEHVEFAQEMMRRKLSGEVIPPYELEILTGVGQRVTLEVNSRLIQHDGKPSGIQGIARDISERKRAEAAMRASEERYRKLFESSPLPMWIYDVETFRFLAVNQAAIDHYGYSKEEFLSMAVSDIRPPDQPSRLGNGGSPSNTSFSAAGVWKHRKKDGAIIHVEVVASPVDFTGRRARLVLISDVTERHRLEEQLRQLQRLESVGQLAAGVAHDFNNILTVIRGHADLLMMREDLDASVAEPVKEVSAAAERAANLTRQLLLFSRKQVLQPKVISLNEVLSNVSKLLKRTLGEHIELKLDVQEGLPSIFADVGMMEQVVTNLAVNARDAMPKGGQLTVGTRLVKIDEAQAQRNQEARIGEFICLSVADTGHGMDTTTLKRIFEPFFTTKEVGKGTGLGLATVYGIVKQHQGWVEVLSALGRGSTFKVYLPITDAKPAPKVSERSTGQVEGGSEIILLVEDEAALRSLASQVLRRAGYTVLTAASGVQALEVWKQHKEEIDLLLTDMVMPEGMSGRDLAIRLQAEDPSLKVVYVSGYSLDLAGEQLKLQEGVNFLQKPYHPQALVKALRLNLDGANHPATRVPVENV